MEYLEILMKVAVLMMVYKKGYTKGKFRIQNSKALRTIPGSVSKSFNNYCEFDCNQKCYAGNAEIACSFNTNGTCTLVESGGIVLNDNSDSKVNYRGILLLSFFVFYEGEPIHGTKFEIKWSLCGNLKVIQSADINL